MLKKNLISIFEWGLFLWFVGYLLGMVFFMFIPSAFIGWAILPFGVVITIWVLLKKIKYQALNNYVFTAFVWTILAIVLDYIFIIKVLKPADGYYKLDVYVYYILMFILPVIIGFYKTKKKTNS